MCPGWTNISEPMPAPKILRRRAGIATPLFSVWSKKSIGVGELPDLELLADWCCSTGSSIIQLLPMNDVGFDFRPYDTESSLALEPMHLSLEQIRFVPMTAFAEEVRFLRKKYPPESLWFDTRIKKDKLTLLKKMFLKRETKGDQAFRSYCRAQQFWLEDYALFKVLKKKMNGSAWETWPEEFKTRKPQALQKIQSEEKELLDFQRWLQWREPRSNPGWKRGRFLRL